MCRVMTRGAEDKGFGCFVHALLGYMEIRSRIPETEQIILAVTCLMARYTVRILTRASDWILHHYEVTLLERCSDLARLTVSQQ